MLALSWAAEACGQEGPPGWRRPREGEERRRQRWWRQHPQMNNNNAQHKWRFSLEIQPSACTRVECGLQGTGRREEEGRLEQGGEGRERGMERIRSLLMEPHQALISFAVLFG